MSIAEHLPAMIAAGPQLVVVVVTREEDGWLWSRTDDRLGGRPLENVPPRTKPADAWEIAFAQIPGATRLWCRSAVTFAHGCVTIAPPDRTNTLDTTGAPA